MNFNDRATGDALILVGITQLLMFAGITGGLGSVFNFGAWDLLISLVLAGLVQWLLYSAIAWAIVRYVVQGSGDYANYLRFTGFAFPTTLLTLAVALVIQEAGWLPFVLGFVWFLAVIAQGIQYESGLSRDRAWLVAVGAFGGLLLADAVFGISPILRP
ncbi:MAG: YIP1 family protein [Acidimicrobiia bacterium]|nr:YIP1 family protein [Acidimicrobiia bacterium]